MYSESNNQILLHYLKIILFFLLDYLNQSYPMAKCILTNSMKEYMNLETFSSLYSATTKHPN